MKIHLFKINQFPLIHELNIGSETITQRKSISMSGTTEDGTEFVAEFSPLPGLHKTGINMIKEEMQNYMAKTPSLLPNPNLSTESNMLLELAQLEILKKKSAFHFYQMFNIDPSIKELKIPMNKLAFIADDYNQYKETPKLKIKIGRYELEKEISWIKSLININPTISLRLDGNRKFSTDLLNEYYKLLPKENIEYWEEPLIDPTEMYLLNSELPLALDETLPIFANQNDFPRGVKTWVIKPSLVGGIKKTIEYIHLAKHLKYHVVISSTFDPPSYLFYLGLLSAMVDPAGKTPMGLDTLKFFKTPPTNETSVVEGDYLKIKLI